MDNIAGFEVSIASNSVGEEIRTMYVLAEPLAFTEQNLTLIFAHFAAEFAKPAALRVIVMSDPARLEGAMNGPIITMEPSDRENPSGRTQQPNGRGRNEGQFEARYIRSFDEDEEYFWYTPDPHRRQEIKITLKERPTKNYTGDLDWDLLIAAEKGDEAKLQILLTRGADPNARDRHGFSALMKAALYGHMAIVEMLLEKRADLNASDENGWTPLMSAASNGNPDIVELLLRKAAEVNLRDRFGNTALLVSASHTESDFEKGRADASKNVTSLLENGADVNMVDNGGETALFKAVGRGDIKMVQGILAKGADPNVKNTSGLTALSAAQRNGRADIAELLIGAGARH